MYHIEKEQNIQDKTEKIFYEGFSSLDHRISRS
jgi:hypothetical protein